jgi:hypothetical protein
MSTRVGVSCAESFWFWRGVLGFWRRGSPALLRLLVSSSRGVSALAQVLGFGG